ncbi:hypothetical protein BD410DRAFT_892718 [Rickenella mellea]|uniref:HIT-type domain-containing protein n=1 Tax=Rickenella mellea TaxID=50990 RepID=A0A4R5XEH5_9AGAM|nr:hypothetical protein BD410DRAFT_892718 [Rickenella mellea]
MSSAQPQCTVCASQLAKYTCPRCTTRTCSAKCVAAHKAATACTGIRDRAAFVPMNQYGWGTMVDDYVFLEDMGRHVSEWGREIARGGLARGGHTARPMRARGRGRGRGHGGQGGAASGGKREFLSTQLGFRDIDMDVLSAGMERHRVNQSTWDAKNKTALMTVEFIFKPPLDPLSRVNRQRLVALTHRNNMDMSLRQLVQGHVKERTKSKKDSELSEWLPSLVCLDDSEATPPLCVMKLGTTANAPALVPHPSKRLAYHKLNWDKKLMSCLRHTQFVEFPTIEVMEEIAFDGVLVNKEGAVERDTAKERMPKRRRVDVVAGKRVITGLLGDYGSDDEAEEKGEEEPSALATLEHYSGSEDDAEERDMDAELQLEGDDPGRGTDLSLILNALHKDGTLQWDKDGDEEEVDWGDSADEADARIPPL